MRAENVVPSQLPAVLLTQFTESAVVAGTTLAAAGKAVTGHIVVTGTVQEAIGSVTARATRLAAIWSSPAKAALTLAGRCNTRVVDRKKPVSDRKLPFLGNNCTVLQLS